MDYNFQSQIDIVSSINSTLNKVAENYSTINAEIENQTRIAKEIAKKLEETSNKYVEVNNSVRGLLDALNNSEFQKVRSDPSLLKNIQNTFNIDLGINALNKLSRESDNATNQQIKALKTASDKADLETKKEPKDNSAEQAKEAVENLKKLTDGLEDVGDSLDSELDKIKIITKIKNFVTSLNPASILINALSMTVNLMGSAVSAYMNAVKTVFTLPFSLAGSLSQLGNSLRKLIVEEIGNKVESLKENFSFDSSVGKNLKSLGKLSENAILESKDTQSLMSRTFGMNNPTAAMEEIKTVLDGLGPLSEYVGTSLSKGLNSGIMLRRIQSELGIGVEELKYYSIDAISKMENLPSILLKVRDEIQLFSKKSGIDFKRLSRIFHSLRKNIKEFDHLSTRELLEVSDKLDKLKVSAEDAVSIFSNISSFDSAVNMSAQLNQGFGMLVDAYDLLSANDPAEMLTMLRDSMFNAGKDFRTLSRHEKSLLKSITGISDHALAATFSYASLGKSQEEIRNEMEKNEPTAVMTSAIESMTDSIRILKKTITFKSPFEALTKGLMGNLSYNKDMIEITTSLNKSYEVLQRSMFNLDDETINRIVTPISILINRFNKLINDGRLSGLFANGVGTVANFFEGLMVSTTETTTDNLIVDFKRTMGKLEKVNTEATQELYAKYKTSFSSMFETLKNKFPKEAKKILASLELLDEKGQLKSELTLDNMSEFFMSMLNSDNVNVKTEVEGVFNNFKSDMNDLISSIKTLSSQDEQNKEALIDAAFKSQGITGLINQIYTGIDKLFDEGLPLFKGIFNLGKTITGGLVKGFFAASTGMIYLINGATDRASELLGKHVEGLAKNKENFFRDLLKIDKQEWKEITGGMEQAANEFAAANSGKLLPMFGLVLKQMYSFTKEIYGILETLIGSSVYGFYTTLEDGSAKKGAFYTVFSSVINKYGHKAAVEKVRTSGFESLNDDERSYYGGLLQNASESFDNSDLSFAYNEDEYKNFQLIKNLKDLKEEENLNKIDYARQFLNSLEYALPYINFIRLFEEKRKEMLSVIAIAKNANIDRREMGGFIGYVESKEIHERNKKLLEIFDAKNSNDIRKFILDDKKSILKDMSPLTFKNMSTLTAVALRHFGAFVNSDNFKTAIAKKSEVNDIIKLHDNDEVEVVASKQGGLLRTLAKEISSRYKVQVAKVKASINKSKLDRKNIDYRRRKERYDNLFKKIEHLVSISKEFNIKVCQEGLEISNK